MDAKHFAAWTRRRFGLAAGSAVAALVAFRHADDAEARKRRCKKLGRPCAFDGRRCCGTLQCDYNYFPDADPNETFCCKPDGASCTSPESCCSTNCGSDGTCTSCRGRVCDEANPCCPKIPCEAGFCGGCAKYGAPCDAITRPCCPDNVGPDSTDCTQGYCGSCIRAQADDETPPCSGTGADCCDTDCVQGLCVSNQGGPCQRNLDCLTCFDSENDPEQCDGACDLDTHTCV